MHPASYASGWYGLYPEEFTLDFVLREGINTCPGLAFTILEMLKLWSVYQWSCDVGFFFLFPQLLNCIETSKNKLGWQFTKKISHNITFPYVKQLLVSKYCICPLVLYYGEEGSVQLWLEWQVAQKRIRSLLYISAICSHYFYLQTIVNPCFMTPHMEKSTLTLYTWLQSVFLFYGFFSFFACLLEARSPKKKKKNLSI